MRRPGVRRDGPFSDQIGGFCRPSQHSATASHSGHTSLRKARDAAGDEAGPERDDGGGSRCSRRRSAGGVAEHALPSVELDDDGGNSRNGRAADRDAEIERASIAADEDDRLSANVAAIERAADRRRRWRNTFRRSAKTAATQRTSPRAERAIKQSAMREQLKKRVWRARVEPADTPLHRSRR